MNNYLNPTDLENAKALNNALQYLLALIVFVLSIFGLFGDVRPNNKKFVYRRKRLKWSVHWDWKSFRKKIKLSTAGCIYAAMAVLAICIMFLQNCNYAPKIASFEEKKDSLNQIKIDSINTANDLKVDSIQKLLRKADSNILKGQDKQNRDSRELLYRATAVISQQNELFKKNFGDGYSWVYASSIRPGLFQLNIASRSAYPMYDCEIYIMKTDSIKKYCIAYSGNNVIRYNSECEEKYTTILKEAGISPFRYRKLNYFIHNWELPVHLTITTNYRHIQLIQYLYLGQKSDSSRCITAFKIYSIGKIDKTDKIGRHFGYSPVDSINSDILRPGIWDYYFDINARVISGNVKDPSED